MKRTREEWLRIASRYVNYCAAVQSVPRVEELAATLGTSRETLTRTFAAATGRSIAATLRAIQIARAKSLLANSSRSTAAIALDTAFGSVRAF